MQPDLSKPYLDYARRDDSPMPTRVRVVAGISLVIGLFELLIGAVLLLAFSNSANSTHKRLVSLPADTATSKKMSAMQTARLATRIEQLRRATTARASLPQPRALTIAEADHVVDVVQAQLPAKLSPAQVKTLAAELQKPGQQLVDVSLPIITSRRSQRTPPYQAVLADTGGGGPGQAVRVMTLRSYFSNDDREGKTFTLGLDGQLFMQHGDSAADRLASVRRIPAPNFPPPNYQSQLQQQQIVQLACSMIAFTQVVAAGALLTGSILGFMGRPRWIRCALLYAYLELVLLLSAVIVIWWSSNNGWTGGPVHVVLSSIFLVVAAYPVLLIFLLPRSRRLSPV